MAKRLRLLLAACLALATADGHAAGDAAAREQARGRIQAERTRIETQFNAELAACQQRFVVTACADEARLRRREALAKPRAEGLALDDIERRERAVARRELVQAKQREASARVAPASPASAPSAPSARVRPAPPPAAAASSVHHHRGAAAASAAEAAAQERSQAARDRQAEIAATQARIRARQAERLREGKVAAPLPVPAASR